MLIGFHDFSIELLGDEGSEMSTRTLTVGEWLEYLKLGSYSQRFQDHGIQDLSEVAQLSAEYVSILFLYTI